MKIVIQEQKYKKSHFYMERKKNESFLNDMHGMNGACMLGWRKKEKQQGNDKNLHIMCSESNREEERKRGILKFTFDNKIKIKR